MYYFLKQDILKDILLHLWVNIKIYLMELRVKEICKEKGILMEELANRLGIARVNLTKTINGNPTIGTLEKIAEALGVEFMELFALSEEIQSNKGGASLTCPHCGKSINIKAE